MLFALATAFVLTFTWVPVAASFLVKHAHPEEGRLLRTIRSGFEPVSRALVSRPRLAGLVFAVLVTLGAVASFSRGAEFVPRLEEGDLVVQLTRPPSVSLGESVAGTTAVETALKGFPEVVRVVSRSGSPDVATDIMGIEQSDVFVMLAPRATWTTAKTREGLVAAMETALRKSQPGTLFAFTQPIEMRSQELLGGIKSDVGIKIFGEDLDVLTHLAHDVEHEASLVRGAADMRVEATTGLEMLTARPDGAGLARHGVRADEARGIVEAMRAGRPVGVLSLIHI